MNSKSSSPDACALINCQVFFYVCVCVLKFLDIVDMWVGRKERRSVVISEKYLKSLCLKGPRSLGMGLPWGLEQIAVLVLAWFPYLSLRDFKQPLVFWDSMSQDWVSSPPPLFKELEPRNKN